jgi:hypothetical protein
MRTQSVSASSIARASMWGSATKGSRRPFTVSPPLRGSSEQVTAFHFAARGIERGQQRIHGVYKHGGRYWR